MKKLFLVSAILFFNFIYSQDAWVQINDFSFETRIKTSYATDDKGYILLYNDDNSIVEFYSYDPTLDSYEQLADFPNQLNDFYTSFVIDNEGYVLYQDFDTSDAVVLLYKYNKIQNTWEQKTSAIFDDFGFGVFNGTAFSINDKGYLASSGGANGNFKEYDPINDSWIAKNNYPGPSEGENLDFTIGDIGYLVFGFDDFNYYPILWSYNQNTETWTQLEDIPWSGGYIAKASFAIGEYGYVGINPAVGSKVFYRYLPSSNNWELIENCGYWTGACFSFSINDIGYVGAGSGEDPVNDGTKQVWKLDPDLLSLGNNDITSLKLYPNPANELINIQNQESSLDYAIFDINGKHISNGTILNNQISISHFRNGTYIIKLIDGNNVSYKFFIKNYSQKTYTVKEATNKLESYCAYQERCHKEVHQKLREMKMIPDAVDLIILHLLQHNFLNETRFAQAFARGKFNYKKWGKMRIVRELKFRDISKYNIDLALKEISDTDYLTTLDALAEKRFLQLASEKNLLKKRKKFVDYLLYRGWESFLVYEKVRELIK